MTTNTDTRARKTPEERAAEVEALAEQLNDAVTTLTTSAAWVGMLRVAARFTRYSPTNVLLLWMQAEQRGVTLTRVAGYRAWQAMGRQVVKGARSLAVRAPVRRRITVEEAAERARTGLTGPSSATSPATPPEGAWEALAELVAREGYRLTADPETGETRGHTDYLERIVNIDPGYPPAERVHTLVHELGHLRCGHAGRRDVSRAQRETEAESMAFIVCTVLGLHVGDVSAVYVGGWTDGDPDTITAAQTAIHTAARSLLTDLESETDTDAVHDESGEPG